MGRGSQREERKRRRRRVEPQRVERRDGWRNGRGKAVDDRPRSPCLGLGRTDVGKDPRVRGEGGWWVRFGAEDRGDGTPGGTG